MPGILNGYFPLTRHVFFVPCLIFCIYGFKDLGLPGLYMDAVNPDYLAAWIQRGSVSIPAWIYPDNWLAGPYEVPLLNSLYGGNSPAYLAALFFKIVGFGAVELRLFHSILGIALLATMIWCLVQWQLPRIAVVIFASLLASDPTYIYAWRTQYYLQLYPLIWFFLGVGLLGGCVVNHENSARRERLVRVTLAGFLIGFSAYSYFIFALYAGSVASVLFRTLRKRGDNSFTYLLTGMIVGFSPYVYAHASIILNTDFSSYVDQIKGLQTAYGVVDTSQGGPLERVSIVAERLAQLVVGRGVETTIFGFPERHYSGTYLALFFVAVFFFLYCPTLFSKKGTPIAKTDTEPKSNLVTMTHLASACLLSHLTFALLVGKPLGVQHYIMTLPLTYMTCAILFSRVWSSETNKILKATIKVTSFVLVVVVLFVNMMTGNRISTRLAIEGGNGLYSDAINTAGLYLKALPTETALLFPQWGYWMGILTITGPRHPIYHAPHLPALEARLSSDSELQMKESFVLILGGDFSAHNEVSIGLEEFSERNQLVLEDVTTIYGRNKTDKITLAHLSRRGNGVKKDDRLKTSRDR